MEQNWFYAHEGMTQGPVRGEMLAQLAAQKLLTPATLVWNSGMTEWIPLRDTGLLPAEVLEPASPPPAGEAKLRLRPALDRTHLETPREARSEPSAVKDTGSPAVGLTVRPIPVHAGRMPVSYGQVKSEDTLSMSYLGQGKPLFRIYLTNVLFGLLTLGFYRFWAQVAVRKYHYQHTKVGRGTLDYHATGNERFVGFLRALLILFPVGGLLMLLFSVYREHWGIEAAIPLTVYSLLFLLFLLRPVLIVGSLSFQLARTSWNNIRFRFTGRIASLYRLYLRDTLLIIITLGLYSPWHQVNLQRFRCENSRLGGQAFHFSGTGGELFVLHLTSWLLSTLTLGLYTPWYFARLTRFNLEHTHFMSARFRCKLTGGKVFRTGLNSVFLTLFTLGFGFPWAVVQWKKLLVESTSLRGLVDADRFVAELDNKANALADGLADAGEALEAVGNLFGG